VVVGQHQVDAAAPQGGFKVGQGINVKKLEMPPTALQNMNDQLVVGEAVLKVEYAKEIQNNDR